MSGGICMCTVSYDMVRRYKSTTVLYFRGVVRMVRFVYWVQ
jgi:hypothetical protein